MTDKPTKGSPRFTKCTDDHGELANSDGATRHSTFIQLLGECRICHSTELYEGPREKLVEQIAHEVLDTHVIIEVDEVEVWDIDDLFYRDVDEVLHFELPKGTPTDAIDRDLEGLRIMRQALLRAASMIARELNAVTGDDE
jgi:hypothetical protein